MRRKHLGILAASLVIAASAGVTYAYLTAQDQVENTFDAAEAEIVVEEDFVPEPPEPGKTIKKAPRVRNVSDTDCYVRILCVFSDSDAESLCEPTEIQSGWEAKDDGYFYWNSAVRPGEETGALFEYVRIREDISETDMIPFDILVYAEAVQAHGMTAAEAWAWMDGE